MAKYFRTDAAGFDKGEEVRVDAGALEGMVQDVNILIGKDLLTLSLPEAIALAEYLDHAIRDRK